MWRPHFDITTLSIAGDTLEQRGGGGIRAPRRVSLDRSIESTTIEATNLLIPPSLYDRYRGFDIFLAQMSTISYTVGLMYI